MRTKIIFSLAAAAILFGLYGLAGSLSQPVPIQTEDRPLPEEPKIQVWRLKQDVVTGERIERRMLALERLPESEANELGFVGDVDLSWQQGTVFRQSLTAGGYITSDDIIEPKQDGYIDYVIAPERVPFPVTVDSSAVVGGVIDHGSLIDLLALTSSKGKVSVNVGHADSAVKQSISITPILTAIKVLQVKRSVISATRNQPEAEEVTLILELTRKQAVKMTVAKKIADIEVHKSIGSYNPLDLHADAGDVLQDFKAITEYRANKTIIK
ncbi:MULTISPECIES: Flp pilus assembly protein CpaB [Photobacterium]|uniref:Flp pilus assembly protein CpaB n=1 Tax=Photobacterium TaxID=657 RepID=UPI001C2DDB95|nr:MULTISPECIES: Flp pilus assembly protein CpaB [Photobacterium]MBV1843120.1 Flp pilus assembly protein CpaB [Photobacterium ganghwense]